MSTTDIQITDLDFDTIKSTLRTYLKGQAVFTDYDFEGSALSTLLDVLAYNTHYNAYYANMIANEMFLDSASQRDSAVSIAKHLGYIPQSKTAASATVTLTLTEDSATSSSVTVPQYSKFTATVDGKSYTFYSMNSYSTTTGDTTSIPGKKIYTISGVVLKEGAKLNKTFIVNNNSINSERYVIPNVDVDASTLVVKVKENTGTADTGYVTYTKHTGVKDLTSTDTIYFLQEVEEGKFELVFGDNVYGKQLAVGNVISVDYLTTKGSLANGAGSDETASTNAFTPSSSTASWAKTSASDDVNVSVVAKVSGTNGSIATGGSEPETMNSIKFVAPIAFQSQNRALTADDYKAIILANYNNVDSIRVWGGEDNARPEYGKVFIVVKPKNGTLLTSQNIMDIKNIVNTYKPLGISISVKSPEYLYLDIKTTVTYNPNLSTETEGTLKSLILSSIMDYNNTNLAKFDSVFRFSPFTTKIDDAENSITSNKTTIGAREHKAVTQEQLSTVNSDTGTTTSGSAYTIGGAIDIVFSEIDLKATIKKGTFKSDSFTTLGKILNETSLSTKTVYYQDNSNGKIDLVTTTGDLVVGSVGTIDYEKGTVSHLSAVNIISILSNKNYLKFTGDIENQDVYPENTQVILFEESDVTVTMKAETV